MRCFSPLMGESLFLASPRKSNQKEGAPAPQECFLRGSLAPFRGALRYSPSAQTVLALFRPSLRCSAPLRAFKFKTNRNRHQRRSQFRPFLTLIPSTPPSSGDGPGAVGEDCLSPKGEFRSRPARRAAQGTPLELHPKGAATCPEGNTLGVRGRLFFGYFLLAKQKKVCPPVRGGTQRKTKPTTRQAARTQ